MPNFHPTHRTSYQVGEPDADVEQILKSLKPNSDVCESILGLNDYLSMASESASDVKVKSSSELAGYSTK